MGPGAVMIFLERRKPLIEFVVGSNKRVALESVSVHYLSGHITHKLGLLPWAEKKG